MSSSHINEKGNASMVDVGEKQATRRVAVATGKVILPDEVLKCVQGADILTPKGAVFQIARIAGVSAAKLTGQLIPLCHPLPLESWQKRESPQKQVLKWRRCKRSPQRLSPFMICANRWDTES
jgi:molybdenum cofactor biosynthesis protein MoaC